MGLNYQKAELPDFKIPKDVTKTLKISPPITLDNISSEILGADEALNEAEKIALDAAREALPKIALKLGDALDAAIRSSVWGWSDGSRDIVDTGQLLNSRNITIQGDGLVISYNVPYFGIIHFGGYIAPYGNSKIDKVYIPARPWITSVVYGGGPVPKFDFEAAWSEALKSLQ